MAKIEPNIKKDNWTILKILTWTDSYFKSHAIDSPRLTAEILLAYSLDIKRLDLYLQYDRPLEKQELTLFKTLIKRRIAKEPVAYITGNKGLFESDFEVTPDVLIPRPDTELIVEQALKILKNPSRNPSIQKILELGTGSGAIVISLAQAMPGHQYVATDISVAALTVAKGNGKKNVAAKINFLAGNWFSCVAAEETFDLIVSNPPYIPFDDIAALQPEIRQFEPMLALDGGPDGLDCYRTILNTAHRHLSTDGVLLLEIGFDQKEGICKLLQGVSVYQTPEFIKDLAGHDRVVCIKKSID